MASPRLRYLCTETLTNSTFRTKRDISMYTSQREAARTTSSSLILLVLDKPTTHYVLGSEVTHPTFHVLTTIKIAA